MLLPYSENLNQGRQHGNKGVCSSYSYFKRVRKYLPGPVFRILATFLRLLPSSILNIEVLPIPVSTKVKPTIPFNHARDL